MRCRRCLKQFAYPVCWQLHGMRHHLHQNPDSNSMASNYNVWNQVGVPALHALSGQHHLYALVDGAQVTEYRRHFLNLPGVVNQVALSGNDLLPEPFNASVHVLQLAHTDAVEGLCRRMAKASNSHGALSLLVVLSPLEVLAGALRRRLDVTLPDNFECINRYFDARVAPHWMACLTPEQQEMFGAFASQWWVVSHEHVWRELACHEVRPDPFATPFAIDAVQQAAMIDACYPYTVIDHFEETDPELLERVAPAAQYTWFHQALQVAERYGIDGGPETMLFCTLTLTRGERFYEASA